MGKSATSFSFEFALRSKFPPYKEIDKVDVFGEYMSREDFDIKKVVWRGTDIFPLIENASLFDFCAVEIYDEAERWIADDIADKSSPNREDDIQDQ